MRSSTPVVIAFWALALALLAALAVAIFASGGTESALAEARPPPRADAPSGAEETHETTKKDEDARRQETETVAVGESAYGPMLFDGRGFALYAFTRDGRGPSRCSDACATAWPPYLVEGRLAAGAGARPELLATVRRADGSRQVTYAGRPLYYYVGDGEPGIVLCQDVVEFGGTWLVVRGSGALVR